MARFQQGTNNYRIEGVDDGTAVTDAVNLRQLDVVRALAGMGGGGGGGGDAFYAYADTVTFLNNVYPSTGGIALENLGQETYAGTAGTESWPQGTSTVFGEIGWTYTPAFTNLGGFFFPATLTNGTGADVTIGTDAVITVNVTIAATGLPADGTVSPRFTLNPSGTTGVRSSDTFELNAGTHDVTLDIFNFGNDLVIADGTTAELFVTETDAADTPFTYTINSVNISFTNEPFERVTTVMGTGLTDTRTDDTAFVGLAVETTEPALAFTNFEWFDVSDDGNPSLNEYPETFTTEFTLTQSEDYHSNVVDIRGRGIWQWNGGPTPVTISDADELALYRPGSNTTEASSWRTVGIIQYTDSAGTPGLPDLTEANIELQFLPDTILSFTTVGTGAADGFYRRTGTSWVATDAAKLTTPTRITTDRTELVVTQPNGSASSFPASWLSTPLEGRVLNLNVSPDSPADLYQVRNDEAWSFTALTYNRREDQIPVVDNDTISITLDDNSSGGLFAGSTYLLSMRGVNYIVNVASPIPNEGSGTLNVTLAFGPTGTQADVLDNRPPNGIPQPPASITGVWLFELEPANSDFISSDDTPTTYAGQAGQFLAVNAGETAVEFVDAPSGGGGGISDEYNGFESVTRADIETTGVYEVIFADRTTALPNGEYILYSDEVVVSIQTFSRAITGTGDNTVHSIAALDSGVTVLAGTKPDDGTELTGVFFFEINAHDRFGAIRNVSGTPVLGPGVTAEEVRTLIGSAVVQDTAPTDNLTDGLVWINCDNGKEYTYLVGTGNGGWVLTGGVGQPVVATSNVVFDDSGTDRELTDISFSGDSLIFSDGVNTRSFMGGSDDERIPTGVTVGNFPRFDETNGNLEEVTPAALLTAIGADTSDNIRDATVDFFQGPIPAGEAQIDPSWVGDALTTDGTLSDNPNDELGVSIPTVQVIPATFGTILQIAQNSYLQMPNGGIVRVTPRGTGSATFTHVIADQAGLDSLIALNSSGDSNVGQDYTYTGQVLPTSLSGDDDRIPSSVVDDTFPRFNGTDGTMDSITGADLRTAIDAQPAGTYLTDLPTDATEYPAGLQNSNIDLTGLGELTAVDAFPASPSEGDVITTNDDIVRNSITYPADLYRFDGTDWVLPDSRNTDTGHILVRVDTDVETNFVVAFIQTSVMSIAISNVRTGIAVGNQFRIGDSGLDVLSSEYLNLPFRTVTHVQIVGTHTLVRFDSISGVSGGQVLYISSTGATRDVPFSRQQFDGATVSVVDGVETVTLPDLAVADTTIPESFSALTIADAGEVAYVPGSGISTVVISAGTGAFTMGDDIRIQDGDQFARGIVNAVSPNELDIIVSSTSSGTFIADRVILNGGQVQAVVEAVDRQTTITEIENNGAVTIDETTGVATVVEITATGNVADGFVSFAGLTTGQDETFTVGQVNVPLTTAGDTSLISAGDIIRLVDRADGDTVTAIVGSVGAFVTLSEITETSGGNSAVTISSVSGMQLFTTGRTNNPVLTNIEGNFEVSDAGVASISNILMDTGSPETFTTLETANGTSITYTPGSGVTLVVVAGTTAFTVGMTVRVLSSGGDSARIEITGLSAQAILADVISTSTGSALTFASGELQSITPAVDRITTITEITNNGATDVDPDTGIVTIVPSTEFNEQTTFNSRANFEAQLRVNGHQQFRETVSNDGIRMQMEDIGGRRYIVFSNVSGFRMFRVDILTGDAVFAGTVTPSGTV